MIELVSLDSERKRHCDVAIEVMADPDDPSFAPSLFVSGVCGERHRFAVVFQASGFFTHPMEVSVLIQKPWGMSEKLVTVYSANRLFQRLDSRGGPGYDERVFQAVEQLFHREYPTMKDLLYVLQLLNFNIIEKDTA